MAAMLSQLRETDLGVSSPMNYDANTIMSGIAPPALPEGVEHHPNVPLPAVDLTEEEMQWAARMEPSVVAARIAAKADGRRGAALHSYLATDTLLTTLQPVEPGRFASAPETALVAYYLVSNMEATQALMPTWTAPQVATYAFYVTLAGLHSGDDEVGKLVKRFSQGPPAKLGERMRQRGADIAGVEMPSQDADLTVDDKLNPAVKPQVQALARAAMSYVAIVVTHLGNATEHRIRKYNQALQTAGLAQIVTTSDAIQSAWTVTRALSVGGRMDICVRDYVVGYLSMDIENLQNFARQALFRTVSPLMVTSFLIGAYPDVGWRTLLGMYPGETSAMLGAAEHIQRSGEDAVYTRCAELAQARYAHVVAAAVCLGKTVYPSLMHLRGKYRSAKLSPQVRQWIHDNRDRISAGSYGVVSDEVADHAAHIFKMVSMAVSMDI